VAGILALALEISVGSSLSAGGTSRLSIGRNRLGPDGDSVNASVTPDGRFVVFESWASNLVTDDTNRKADIFVVDRQLRTTTRVSVSSTGHQGNKDSFDPAITPDGRYVVFRSLSSNLVPGDTNGKWDVFLHDRVTGSTARMSVPCRGSASLEADGDSFAPAISDDGKVVAFHSAATNLVPNDQNRDDDVFVRDLNSNDTFIVSVGPGGMRGRGNSRRPSLSTNGSMVLFDSDATHLVYGKTTNGKHHVFLHDRQTGSTTQISVTSAGAEGNKDSWAASMTPGGNLVAFHSDASNLVSSDTNYRTDVFVRDVTRGITTRVSISSTGQQADQGCMWPTLSPDGDFVAFSSTAATLVSNDRNAKMDVFLHQRSTRTTTRVSETVAGLEGNDHSRLIGNATSTTTAVSRLGRTVVFESKARLVHFDVDTRWDVYYHDRYPTLSAGTVPRPGVRVVLNLLSPADPHKTYALASSLSYIPGIRIDRFRDIPLNVDNLFLFSMTAPASWQKATGILDGQGRATAYILIPNIPKLRGIAFYTAFLTVDPGYPTGIKGISDALRLQIH